MGRVVYSFSIPEESEAAWLLKKYKREGKTISHIIQNALEYGAKEQNELKKELEWEKKHGKRSSEVLREIFGVMSGDFVFYEHQPTTLRPHQPIEALIMAKEKLGSRTEWTLAKMERF